MEDKYKGRVNVKIYKAGKDFDYIRKYGMFSKSVLILNENKIVENVNRNTIENAFKEVVDEL